MKKGIRTAMIILAGLLILVVVAGLIAGNYFYTLALDPTSDKGEVLNADHNQVNVSGEDEDVERWRESRAWFEASGRLDIYMDSDDGLKLHAYLLEQVAPSQKWVILAHGYTGNAAQMAGAGRHFYDNGFNLLLPDARGHGGSEGEYIGMGWHDRLDYVGWINRLISDYGDDIEIVLFGVSMGGATVMMTAGEPLPNNVKAVVEDCGYTSAKAEFAYQLHQLFGLPSFPVINFSSLVTKLRAGYWFGEASALEQVKKSTTPIFFIHGSADTFVPSSMVHELYDACTADKELMVVEGAGHGAASSVAGDSYWQRVDAFVGRYVK